MTSLGGVENCWKVWVLHQPPWSFGFDSQTRGTRENRVSPCVKVQGSSRVPPIQVLASHQHYASMCFEEQLQLHLPQNHKVTVPESSLHVEMNTLEEQADKDKSSYFYWKTLVLL